MIEGLSDTGSERLLASLYRTTIAGQAPQPA